MIIFLACKLKFLHLMSLNVNLPQKFLHYLYFLSHDFYIILFYYALKYDELGAEEKLPNAVPGTNYGIIILK